MPRAQAEKKIVETKECEGAKWFNFSVIFFMVPFFLFFENLQTTTNEAIWGNFWGESK